MTAATTPASGRAPAGTSDSDLASRLGAKAQARRKALGLSRAHVAGEIGINPLTLVKWEARFPIRKNGDSIARWARAIDVPMPWMYDPEAVMPEGPGLSAISLGPPGERTARDEILALAAWLSEPRFRKRISDFSRLTPHNARNALIFAQRYGCDGEDRTLESIGSRLGLTRERVRQICATMLTRTVSTRVETPAILSLIADMQECLPAPVSSLEERFRDRLGPNQSLLGLYEFATEVLATRIFELRKNITGHTLLRDQVIACRVGDDLEGLGRAVYEQSCRMIRSCGAAQAHHVFGLCAQEGASTSYAEYLRLLTALPGFEWLEERSGWYWLGGFSPAVNRAVLVARKILAVAQQRVDVSCVVSSLARNRRRNNVHEPDANEIEVDVPRAIILEVLTRTPGIAVRQLDDVVAEPRIEPAEVLSGTEMLLFRELSARGGVASWRELQTALCDGAGTQDITFNMALRTTPIVEVLDFGLYRLIGLSLATDAAMQSVLRWRESTTPLGGTLLQIGENSAQESPITVDVRLARNIYTAASYDAPAALKPFLEEGQAYSVKGVDQSVNVRIYTEGQRTPAVRLSGMHRVFRAIGLAPGDMVRLTLHPAARYFEITAAPQTDLEQAH